MEETNKSLVSISTEKKDQLLEHKPLAEHLPVTNRLQGRLYPHDFLFMNFTTFEAYPKFQRNIWRLTCVRGVHNLPRLYLALPRGTILAGMPKGWASCIPCAIAS
jgi:hypothetical protein